MSGRITARRGILFALISMTLWAAGSVLTKHSLNYFPPLTLLVIELAASVCMLSVLLAATWNGQRARQSAFRLAAPGLLQPGLAYVLSFVGLKWLDSVSIETLIWSAEGVAMIPFSVMFVNEKVTLRSLILGLVALFGIGLVTIPSGPARAVSRVHLEGTALIVGAVFSACSYTVLAQRDLRDHAPLLLTTLHHLAGLAFALSFALATRADGASQILTPNTIAEASLAGVCLFALPFWLYLRSVKLIGSSSAAQFLPAVPVLTIFFAKLFLHETLTSQQILGTVVTICAVLGMVWSTAHVP